MDQKQFTVISSCQAMMRRLDPFGIALNDYQRGNHAHPCMIERDDGVLIEEPISPYFEKIDGWRDEEKEALACVRSRALDLGCGAGRHLLDLQNRAFVVGLDSSRLALQVCRERGGRILVLGCAERLPFRAGSFETVLLMNNSLGISGDLKRTCQMLRDVRRVLSTDGELIGHTSNPNGPDSAVDDAYRSKNLRAHRPAGFLRIRVRYRSFVGPWFELLLLSPDEVEAVFKKVGLGLRRTIPWGSSGIYFARSRRCEQVDDGAGA